MTDLADLATRIEREPPRREMDAEIAALTRNFHDRPAPTWFINWDGELHATPDGRVTAMQANGKEGPWMHAPHYTTSRDAAAGLMPAGWQLRSLECHREQWACTLHRVGTGDLVVAVAPTEPQARTAAALRAMEMERGAKPPAAVPDL